MSFDNQNDSINLSFDSFIEVLNVSEIIHDNDISLINCFSKDNQYTQSALQIAEKLGYSDIGPVNALIGKFAKRIADYFHIELEREGNSPGWWRVIAEGNKVDGTWYWTLKYDFIKALETLQLLESEPNYWLLPANEDNYDVEKAYLQYHTIDWHQTNSQIAVNDIVYIYKTKPYQIIRFRCQVKAVNKRFSNKKDLDCYKDSTPYENKDHYMTLQFINRIEDVFPTMEGLKENGIPVIRGLIKIPDLALKYIQGMEKEDYSVKRFDGIIPDDIPVNHWSLVGGDEEEINEQNESEARELSDSALLKKAKQQGSTRPKIKASTTSTYVRNPYVAEYAKRRANGICQLCKEPAPFNDKKGKPYLESHHIVWLCENGTDDIYNTVALCPNCHKKMHIVNNIEDIKFLQESNKQKE